MKFLSLFSVIIAVFILVFSALFFVFLFSSQDTVYTNISYGNHPQQKFDIYFPDKLENMSENSPVFLYIHGGGWTSGDKTEGKEMQKAVNDMGCIFVSMNYRLIHETNDADCSDMLCDIDDVVKYLALHSETYHIDTEKMAIGGSSAGGIWQCFMLIRTTVPFRFNSCCPCPGRRIWRMFLFTNQKH